MSIKKFFETEVYKVNRRVDGTDYEIYVSKDPLYANEAVIDNTIVDVSSHSYDDFESFIECVVEEFEKKNW